MIPLVVALLVASAAANVITNDGRPCLHPVNCFVDPCAISKGCPGFPEAQCSSNYCGGCHAYYYVNGKRVICGSAVIEHAIADASATSETEMMNIAPAVKGVCPMPKPNTVGLCAEMCNNCEAKGQLCCSNGCGHACTNPVMPPTEEKEGETQEKRQIHLNMEEGCPPLSHGGFGACIMSCTGHQTCQQGYRCCSTGCGRVCKQAYYGNGTNPSVNGSN